MLKCEGKVTVLYILRTLLRITTLITILQIILLVDRHSTPVRVSTAIASLKSVP